MNLTPNSPLVLVGAGKMGGALLTGWLTNGVCAESIVVSDPNLVAEFSKELTGKGIRILNGTELNFSPLAVVFAVKPQMMGQVLTQHAETVKNDTLVISIAAGTPISTFESVFNGAPVIRAMPNTPVQVRRGITAAVGNNQVSQDHKTLVDGLLSAVGKVVWLEFEDQIDMVTGVSGSGPAYLFLLAECLAEAGRHVGLPAETAQILAEETVSGAGELLYQSDIPPDELRKNVTSPGGTTEAALKVLMDQSGMQSIMNKAVAEAVNRARELAARAG